MLPSPFPSKLLCHPRALLSYWQLPLPGSLPRFLHLPQLSLYCYSECALEAFSDVPSVCPQKYQQYCRNAYLPFGIKEF